MCVYHHSWVLQPGPAAAHGHRSRALRSYGALRTGCGGGFAAFEQAIGVSSACSISNDAMSLVRWR